MANRHIWKAQDHGSSGKANQNHNDMSHTYWDGYYQKEMRLSVGKNVKKRELLYSVGGNVNWYSYCRKQYGGSSKLKIELSYDLAISPLGIYSKEMKSAPPRIICVPMFIILFTIGKI